MGPEMEVHGEDSKSQTWEKEAIIIWLDMLDMICNRNIYGKDNESWTWKKGNYHIVRHTRH